MCAGIGFTTEDTEEHRGKKAEVRSQESGEAIE
jgi:hypothetical protein